MKEKAIPVITKSYTANVKVKDIVKIERYNRKINIVTDKGDYWFYGKIDNMTQYLDDRFYPCIQGCYINFDRVESMANQMIFFDNGCQYSLGRTNYIRTRQVYSRFLIEKNKKD